MRLPSICITSCECAKSLEVPSEDPPKDEFLLGKTFLRAEVLGIEFFTKLPKLSRALSFPELI